MVQGFQSFVLGTIQGLTEFLPVSSSAHLVLVPWLLSWQDQGLAFDVALHLGTLLALLIYYWRYWLEMAASLVNGDRPKRRLLWLLVTASIPGAIIGLAFEKEAETVFRSPLLIAFALALLGVALWLFDRFEPQRRTMEEMTYLDALLIGLSQAFAIVPGVSRSGSTITMGRIVRLNREDAANFSFLMATPIIAGAGLVEGRHLMANGISNDVWIGFIAAAVFGLFAIAALIRFVRTRSYEPFVWYRIIFAILVVEVFLHRA
ncbi:MAG TPA: undecaprenyl-diphosphatase UppP [Candidatus Binataceae bacterium]|nr:undecaprenyl-diphosphatase UppP [Candidatus Binataceae bacterium]